MSLYDGTDVSIQGRWLRNGNPIQVCCAPIAFSCSRYENFPVRITIIAGTVCPDGSHAVSDSVIFESENPNVQHVLETLNHPDWVIEPLLAQFLLIANNFETFVDEDIDTQFRYLACLEMLQGLGRQLDKDESSTLDLVVGQVNNALTKKALAHSALSEAEQYLTQVWGCGLQAWKPDRMLTIFRSLIYPNGYGYASLGLSLDDGFGADAGFSIENASNPTERLNRLVMDTSALYGSCYYALTADNPFEIKFAGLDIVGPPFRHYCTAVSLETGFSLGGKIDQTSLNFLTYRDLCSDAAALCNFADPNRPLLAFTNPATEMPVASTVRAPVHTKLKKLVEKLRIDALSRLPDLSALASDDIGFIIPPAYTPMLSRTALEFRVIFTTGGLWLSVLHSKAPLEYSLVFFASSWKDNINCHFRFLDAWIIRALMASIWDSACDDGRIALFPNAKQTGNEIEDAITGEKHKLPHSFYLGWKYQNLLVDLAGACLRLN